MKYIEVYIENAPFKDTVDIWIKADDGTRGYNIHYNDGYLIETEIDINSIAPIDLKPFLSLPRRMAGKIIEGLTKEANHKGINTKQENIFEGKLAAKEIEIEFLKAQLEKFVNKATR